MRSPAGGGFSVCLPTFCWFVSLVSFLCFSANTVVPSGCWLRDTCVLCLVECTILRNGTRLIDLLKKIDSSLDMRRDSAHKECTQRSAPR